jgi:hypothetical protein
MVRFTKKSNGNHFATVFRCGFYRTCPKNHSSLERFYDPCLTGTSGFSGYNESRQIVWMVVHEQERPNTTIHKFLRTTKMTYKEFYYYIQRLSLQFYYYIQRLSLLTFNIMFDRSSCWCFFYTQKILDG